MYLHVTPRKSIPNGRMNGRKQPDEKRVQRIMNMKETPVPVADESVHGTGAFLFDRTADCSKDMIIFPVFLLVLGLRFPFIASFGTSYTIIA